MVRTYLLNESNVGVMPILRPQVEKAEITSKKRGILSVFALSMVSSIIARQFKAAEIKVKV